MTRLSSVPALFLPSSSFDGLACTYWEKRYTIRSEQFPNFLRRVKDKILTAGKYLNVIRECGHKVVCPDAKKLKYTFHEREYVEAIEHAFNFSSRALLDLLVKDHCLLDRLR